MGPTTAVALRHDRCSFLVALVRLLRRAAALALVTRRVCGVRAASGVDPDFTGRREIGSPARARILGCALSPPSVSGLGLRCSLPWTRGPEFTRSGRREMNENSRASAAAGDWSRHGSLRTRPWRPSLLAVLSIPRAPCEVSIRKGAGCGRYVSSSADPPKPRGGEVANDVMHAYRWMRTANTIHTMSATMARANPRFIGSSLPSR